MFKKLWLTRKINHFYKTFGEYFGMPNTRIKIRELKDYWIMTETHFHVREALEEYYYHEDEFGMCRWLRTLERELENYRI